MAKPVAKSTNKAAAAAQHQGRAAPAARPTAVTPRAQPQPARPAPSQQLAVEDEFDRNLPAHMLVDSEMGKEDITREDLETPRLKLMQGLSPELQLYDGLRPGYFFHSAAEHVFDGPFTAVPLLLDKRYILWRPRDQGGGILARADDGIHWSPADAEFTVQLDKKDGGHTVTWRTAPTVAESGLNLWGTMNPSDKNSPPAATQMYNFVLAFPDYPDLMPAVLSFQRSLIKPARRFITKIKTLPGALFRRKYRFTPVKDHNKAGQEFFNVNITADGVVEDDAQYESYRSFHLSYKSAGLPIKDIESLQDEQTVGDEIADEPEATASRRRY